MSYIINVTCTITLRYARGIMNGRGVRRYYRIAPGHNNIIAYAQRRMYYARTGAAYPGDLRAPPLWYYRRAIIYYNRARRRAKLKLYNKNQDERRRRRILSGRIIRYQYTPGDFHVGKTVTIRNNKKMFTPISRGTPNFSSYHAIIRRVFIRYEFSVYIISCALLIVKNLRRFG